MPGQKPLLNINNPKPITPGGAYWLVGLEPQVIGNRNQLRQNWRVNFQLNTQSHANWANLPIIIDVCSKTEQNADMFYGIGNKYISRHASLNISSEDYGAIIHTMGDFCAFPGIINTEQGNMLYTSEQHLGKAYYGYHTGSTQTLKVVDKAGRNFTGLTGTIINLKDNTTATITSISTTTATGDTINFSGGWSDSGNMETGDEWVVFVDEFQTLHTSTLLFGGQLTYVNWSRQIINFFGDYFILHGNYIAKLNNDETTFDEDYTQLPSFVQGNCADVVGNNILIGGSIFNKGILLLWDGVTANKYASFIYLPNPVIAIKEYKGGAIFLSGSSLYWTDGYSYKKLSDLPGTDGVWKLTGGHSSIMIDGDFVFVNNKTNSQSNFKTGVWVYSISGNSWTHNPYETATKKMYIGGGVGGVFSIPSSNLNTILASYTADYPTLSVVSNRGLNNFSMAVFSYTAPKNTKISYAELVLGQTMNTTAATAPSIKAMMALSDGKKPFWMYGIVRTTASNNNEIPVDGSQTTYNKAVVGDMIMMLDGVCGGEYAFITSISGQGTNTEVWTLDRNLTGKVVTSENIQIINCRKMGEATVTDYFSQPIRFSDGMIVNGDFYVIIIIQNTTGYVDIRDISLF